MKTSLFITLIIAAVFFGSCSIEKRHYRDGYAVTWNTSSQINPAISMEEEILNAAPEEKRPEINTEMQISPADMPAIKDSCDIITLRNNTTIQANVIEIHPATIRYINCGDLNGPKRIIPRSDILQITYANGLKEVYADVQEEEPVAKTSAGPVYNLPPAKSKADKLATHAFIAGFCSFIPVAGWVFAILGMSFGTVSLIKNRNEKSKHTEKIIAGIGVTFAIIGLIAGITILCVYFPGFFPAVIAFLLGA